MARKSQFTDEQTTRALREVDAGAKPANVCRRLGVTDCYGAPLLMAIESA